MRTQREVYEGDLSNDEDYSAVEDRTVQRPSMLWSPAQVVGLVVGLGFVVLGIAAVAETGFDTSHIYRPHAEVWSFPHSPLLGVCEIGFGALLVLASVVPGAVRSVMALLGAAAVGFGVIIVADVAPVRMSRWFAVSDRSGWLFITAGAVVALFALFAPNFGGGYERRVRRDTYVGAHDRL